MELFFMGTLPSGKSVYDYVEIVWGMGVSVLPNVNMNNMRDIFYNEAMTLEGYESGIKEQREKYEDKDAFTQFWYANLKYCIDAIEG